MRGSGKIVIRPRNARKSQPSPSPEPEPEPEASEHSGEGSEQQQQEEDAGEESEGGEDAQEGSQKDDTMDVDEGGDEEDGDAVQESAPAPRGTRAGDEAAEGRAATSLQDDREAGHGEVDVEEAEDVGRGSSVLLKLPRRGADSDGTGDVDGDAEDSQAATPGADEFEVLEPIAGGKPFRRIQGQIHVIENDEFITDEDLKGDEKIDANGNLLGGMRSRSVHSDVF